MQLRLDESQCRDEWMTCNKNEWPVIVMVVFESGLWRPKIIKRYGQAYLTYNIEIFEYHSTNVH